MLQRLSGMDARQRWSPREYQGRRGFARVVFADCLSLSFAACRLSEHHVDKSKQHKDPGQQGNEASSCPEESLQERCAIFREVNRAWRSKQRTSKCTGHPLGCTVQVAV